VDADEVVTCGPADSVGWTYASILSVCGGLLLLIPAFLRWGSVQGAYKPMPATTISTWGMLGTMVVCCWGVAAWNAAHELRACIVADDKGLRWRNVGTWHTLRWDDITRVYVQPQSRGHTQFVVQGKANTLRVQDYGWRNVPALRGFVLNHVPREVLENGREFQ
jgi:hypothetical protein